MTLTVGGRRPERREVWNRLTGYACGQGQPAPPVIHLHGSIPCPFGFGYIFADADDDEDDHLNHLRRHKMVMIHTLYSHLGLGNTLPFLLPTSFIIGLDSWRPRKFPVHTFIYIHTPCRLHPHRHGLCQGCSRAGREERWVQWPSMGGSWTRREVGAVGLNGGEVDAGGW